MSRSIAVEHNGKHYSGQVMRIASTSLGTESHGILTVYLNCEFPGGGVGVGGFCLDTPVKDSDGRFLRREGTAFGLDHIVQIMRTVGVSKWEDLPGKQVIVLHEGGGSGLGKQSKGIANLLEEGNVLILEDHASEWTEKLGAAS